MTLKRELNLNN